MFHHWWWNVFKAHFCVRMFWREHSHRCAVCVGHCLLCEMTLISLLPNLAGSISPAIIGERGREDGGEEGFMLIIGLPPCTICLCAPEHSCTLTGICRSDVGRLLTLSEYQFGCFLWRLEGTAALQRRKENQLAHKSDPSEILEGHLHLEMPISWLSVVLKHNLLLSSLLFYSWSCNIINCVDLPCQTHLSLCPNHIGYTWFMTI